MAHARTVHDLKPQASVRANARKIIATRADEFLSFAPYLADPAHVTQLHDMRIAAKRLRYALELFQDALGPDAAGCLATVKAFQEIAGEIHDGDVLAGILRDHLAAISADRARALAEIAVQSGDEIETLKERGRAFVSDAAWIAEQAAIAAAIARVTRERRQGYDHLIRQWNEWCAAGLPERLMALAG